MKTIIMYRSFYYLNINIMYNTKEHFSLNIKDFLLIIRWNTLHNGCLFFSLQPEPIQLIMFATNRSSEFHIAFIPQDANSLNITLK